MKLRANDKSLVKKTVARLHTPAYLITGFSLLFSFQVSSHSFDAGDDFVTPLGKFLAQEIYDRVEVVSHRKWVPNERREFSKKLASSIAKEAYEQEIDPFLLLAIVEVESRYNKRAIGSVGELGLMQIRPSTAKTFTECNLHKVHCNIQTGARYLAYLKKLQKRRDLTFPTEAAKQTFLLQSYNYGPKKAYQRETEKRMIAATLDNGSGDGSEDGSEAIPAPTYAEKVNSRLHRFRNKYLTQTTPESKPETSTHTQSIALNY